MSTIYTITFKRAYTSRIYEVQINSSYTIKQFLEQSKNRLSGVTGLPSSKISIVESGQTRGEDGIELEESNEIFGHRFSRYIPSFYFKPSLRLSTGTDSCCVCLDESPRQMIQTDCSHCLCSRCYNQIFERGIRTCPLCRSQTII
jgi:hypothetical protein